MHMLAARIPSWRRPVIATAVFIVAACAMLRWSSGEETSHSFAGRAPVVVADSRPIPPRDVESPHATPDDDSAPRRGGMFDDIPMPAPPGALQATEAQRPSISVRPFPPDDDTAVAAPTGDNANLMPQPPAPPVPDTSRRSPGVTTHLKARSGQFESAVADSTPFARDFDDPRPEPAAKIDPASFNGVQPGTTTFDDLVKKWGQGKETAQDGTDTIYSYAADPFPRVDVTVSDGIVRAMVLHLKQPTPPGPLTKQLKLTDVRPVNVPDDAGDLLGQSFPERGVLLVFEPGGKVVSHVVLDKINLEPFVLRCEADFESNCRRSFADLSYVLREQPDHARALWLRAKILASQARYDEALKSVDAALASNDDEPAFQLTRAGILGCQDRYDEAITLTKSVAETADLPNQWKAIALCQLGDMLAADPDHDYRQAADNHMAAIKLAEPLAASKQPHIRRAGKHVLLEAHLGMANDIASGYWQQKDRVVPQWLDRARQDVDDLIAHEGADPSLRLHLAREALRVCAGSDGKVESTAWTKLALDVGNKLMAGTSDPWTKERLEWEMGLALSDSLISGDPRGTNQHSLANSALTVTHLEAGAKGRRETPDDAFRLGRMYYRVGSLHAVQRNDHKTAVAWYEKSLSMLDRPIPATHRADQGRYGQWLVSMGISYWEIGRREDAVDLTDAGSQHLQEAVANKYIEEKALAVPYNNLSSMHQALGHKPEAKNFSEMASKLEGAKAEPKGKTLLR